jgi:GT2 family glycosyltransferase
MSELGAVILHWRHWPEVRNTIDALLAEGIDPVDVRIVDNASRDGSVERIRSAYPELRGVLEMTDNRGYAAGMNAGVRDLGTKDVLLLTHETIVRPGSVRTLRARLDADRGVEIVGPMITLKGDPGTVFSEGGRFNRRMAISHHSSGEPVAAHELDDPQSVDWLDGSCLLIRREVFESIGFLDEGYFLYYEETDFMARGRLAGWRIECVPAARAMQQPGPKPTALWTRNRLRFLHRNATLRMLLRQILVDLRTVALGPERALTAYGVAGYLFHADPAWLYRVSTRASAGGRPRRTARRGDPPGALGRGD